MNVLVVGCGDLGSRLSDVLCHHGHEVSVIDVDENAFRNLGEDFDGMTVTGMPMDMGVLRSAGVESCDAVAVVTSDDNLNITVSQIVKEFFHVDNVIARITDPVREKVFNHFGLRTICQTKLSCEAVFSALTSNWKEKQLTVGSSTISFNVRGIDQAFVGRDVNSIPVRTGESILGILTDDGHLVLNNHKDKLMLNPSDKILYTKLVD